MKYSIFMGSPKHAGNTVALLDFFLAESKSLGVDLDVFWLYEKDIRPCLGCGKCQDLEPGSCVQRDDFLSLYQSIQSSDVLLFATPIYSWYCTAPMKASLDRLISSGCPYYGHKRQLSGLRAKRVASLITCGYPIKHGADLWEDGLKRYCEHGEMEYLGIFRKYDLGNPNSLIDEKTQAELHDFAQALYLAANQTSIEV